jgi:hypothetical protein
VAAIFIGEAVSDEELPTGPGEPPPDSFHEEDQAEKFARLVAVALAPIKEDSAAVRGIAREVFDEFQKFRFEVRNDVDSLKRRLTAVENEVVDLHQRVGQGSE